MPTNKEGQRIPQVVFHTLREHEAVDRTTDNIFSAKNVILFALPGAFTPTCSSTHVPRFNQLTPIFKQHGIDEVLCLSVNDPFVMGQWQKEQKAYNLTFIPDGNGEFSSVMGMLNEKLQQRMGNRSKRYSMLVRDGVIEKIFLESDEPGKAFEVSDADTMLNYIAPEASKPVDATIFSRDGCSFCVHAKQTLTNAGIEFDELILNRDFKESTLRSVSGKSTAPQIFINGNLIGGSEALDAYLATAENS